VNDVPRALLSQPLIESGKEIAAHFGISWHHSYQAYELTRAPDWQRGQFCGGHWAGWFLTAITRPQQVRGARFIHWA